MDQSDTGSAGIFSRRTNQSGGTYQGSQHQHHHGRHETDAAFVPPPPPPEAGFRHHQRRRARRLRAPAPAVRGTPRLLRGVPRERAQHLLARLCICGDGTWRSGGGG
eukprot:4472414-Pyramimonas_sp.AAC.1